MNTCAAIIVCAMMALTGTARAAGYASPVYDAKAAPLDDLSRELLTSNGYELRDDGRVWDKIGESSVSRDDMPFLLSRLASARRLRALLQINAIITKYDAERKLTAEDREAVRVLARQNWIVFGLTPRRDFRSYFSLQELEALDQIPPRYETMSPVTMTDPTIEAPTAAAPKSITASPPPVPLPAPPPATSIAPPSAPLAPPAAAPVIATVAAGAVMPSTPILATPELGVFKRWIPPTSTATVVIATVAAPAPAAALVVATMTAITPAPVSAAIAPAIISAADYEKFVSAGPYSKEGRMLLELIGKRAPDFCLPLLRRTVVATIPQIVFDGARTGSSSRAGIVWDASNPQAPPLVALSPGPIVASVKSGLFAERTETVLAESPAAWAQLGVPRPALDAFIVDKTPILTEHGPWGSLRVFPDGSRRGTYSSEEQAGELLEQLLLIGLSREGFDASPYAARRWARTARLMFSMRLKEDSQQDLFLDPDRRLELRAWSDQPAEEDDIAIASWAGSRMQAFDPLKGPPLAERAHRESTKDSCSQETLALALTEASRARARRVGILETLVDSRTIDSTAAAEAAKTAATDEASTRALLLKNPPPCPASVNERGEGLRKSALLAAEAAHVERSWRESMRAGDRHAH